jgi:hypothetical protein
VLSLSLAGAPKGTYFKETTYGGSAIRSSRVNLSGGGETELKVTVARDGGALTATVHNSEGQPVPDVWVILMSAAVTTESELSTALNAGVTNRFGIFEFNNLRPGKYLAMAIPTWLDLSRENVARLWRARTGAKEVEIGAGSAVQVILGITRLE